MAGACLIVLLTIIRASLQPAWWQAWFGASWLALFAWLTYDRVASWNLGRVYALFQNRDWLVLLLLLPVVESILGIRAALRMVDGSPLARWWQRLLGALPNLSCLGALLLLHAHAFHFISAIDFDQLGWAFAVSVWLGCGALPRFLQWLLPEREWRIELYLLLRVLLLLGLFAGYALVTLAPTPAPDASFSWKGLGLLLALLIVIGGLGALLHGWLLRMIGQRLTTDWRAH